MKIVFPKGILVIGSIFCGLISPLKSGEKESIENMEKYMAAMTYGYNLCFINSGKYSKEDGEKYIVDTILEEQIFTGHFKDKKVEILGERLSERYGRNCNLDFTKKEGRKFLEQDLNFLLDNSKQSESKLFKDLFLKRYYSEISSSLCKRYKSKKNFDVKSYLDNTATYIFFRNFNPNFADLPKNKSRGELTDLISEQMNTYYNIYKPYELPEEKFKEFINIHLSICPREGTNSWNYFIAEYSKIYPGALKKNQNKISSSKAKNIDNKKNEKHEKCLKAADYKGCMNYQNR